MRGGKVEEGPVRRKEIFVGSEIRLAVEGDGPSHPSRRAEIKRTEPDTGRDHCGRAGYTVLSRKRRGRER